VKNEGGKKAKGLLSGIRRVSAPIIAAFVYACSLQGRSGSRPAHLRRWRGNPRSPFLSLFLDFILFFQAGALPVHLGFLLLPPNAKAVTQGCKKKTCCMALCYVDRHGIHHCVHRLGESCECGISSHDLDANPIFLSTVVTFPDCEGLLPDLIPNGWMVLSGVPPPALIP
jgi:hypothetical protein